MFYRQSLSFITYFINKSNLNPKNSLTKPKQMDNENCNPNSDTNNSQTPNPSTLSIPSSPTSSRLQTKQQKQLYLRDQIIQPGYNAQQFIVYLNTKLDIDSDLDKCTFSHLEQVVQDFKRKKQRQDQEINCYFGKQKKQRKGSGNNGVQQSEKEERICQKGQQGVYQPVKVIIRTNPEIVQQQFHTTYKCIKIQNKYQKTPKIQCEVNNPQRKYMGGVLGIGGTSFLCFDVWSHGLSKQSVSRRYSDFVWLRNILLKFYPSYIIPPIPEKKASKRLPIQIRKRMRILSYFLNDVVKIPVLMNNKYVEGFLLIKEEKQFQKLKQQGDKKKAYQNVLSTETLTGKIELQLSNKTIKYKDGLVKFIPQIQKLYKQITRNSKRARILTMQKINILYEMSNQFGDLYKISNKFNIYAKNQSTQKLTQIYAILNNVMAQWGNSLKKSMDDIQKNMSTFFKYARQQLLGFKELIQKTNNTEEIWIKEKQNLQKLKEKIFLLRDTKKWDISKKDLDNLPKSALYDRSQAFKIMLPKQSVLVNNYKQNYVYYLSQLNRHGSQNLQRTAQRFCDNFRQFSIKTKVGMQQIGAMWTQVSYKFTDPYNKKHQIWKLMPEKPEESENQESGNYDD